MNLAEGVFITSPIASQKTEALSSPKIGIFGGTFDPPHEAHLRLLEDVLKTENFSQIYIIPSKFPPDKSASAPYELRLDWTRRAFQDRPQFIVSDFEARSEQTVFGIDIAFHVFGRNPKSQCTWILGDDQFTRLNFWQRIDEYADRLDWLVLHRQTKNDSQAKVSGLSEGLFSKKLHEKSCRYRWAHASLMSEVSSSMIRQGLAAEAGAASCLKYVPESIRPEVIAFYSQKSQKQTEDS